MDPAYVLLLRDALKLTAAAYFSYLKADGKTDEEIDASFKEELEKAKNFNPATDIKDV